MKKLKSVKRCKMSMKEKNGKTILTMQGYCNFEKPDEKINREIEIDDDLG